jgi:hypothetical protein
MPKVPKILPTVIVLVLVLVTVSFALRGRGEDPFGFLRADKQATIELTVVYDDGSVRDFSAVDLSVTSLQITDESGKVISEIRANVRVKVDWEGTYESQLTSGSVKFYQDSVGSSTNDPWDYLEGGHLSVVSPVAGMTLKNTYRFTYANDLSKGAWVTIASVTYSNLALETWTDTGANSIQVIANLEVTVTFTDGSTDSMTGGGGTIFIVNKGTPAAPTGGLTLVDVGVVKTDLN